jgi:hypothetical protein
MFTPKVFASTLMSEFDRNQTLGAGTDRQTEKGADKHVKNDYQIFSNGRNINFEPFEEKIQ